MEKIIVFLTLALLFVSCDKKNKPEENQPNTETSNSKSNSKPDNIFTTIKEAVTKSIALRCEYTDEDGSMTITYIKGNLIRLEGTSEAEKNVMGIMRDNKIYLWDKTQTQGIVMDLTKQDEKSSYDMGGKKITSNEDVIAVLEENKDKCKAVTMSDSDFSLPENIEFKEFDF